MDGTKLTSYCFNSVALINVLLQASISKNSYVIFLCNGKKDTVYSPIFVDFKILTVTYNSKNVVPERS
jgi:hypothetical protein